jgi:CubicO group peptidase (beta-lactamase class C family)
MMAPPATVCRRRSARPFLFAITVLLALAGWPEPLLAQSFAGDWRGSIAVPGAPLAVTVHLTEASGTLVGTIDIPAQGAEALPLERLRAEAAKIEFTIADTPGAPTFRGERDASGDKIAGTFTQAGQRLKFELVRAAAAAAATAGKFDGLQQWLDETRTMFEVPGIAVAIVEGERVLATLQSGQRDVAADQPVTADTLFAIGSSTKAFTTCLLAMLVDDGRLEWDAPVRRWLPDFALADAAVGERLTPRDLVTHRSGMPRHDLVWYGASFARADMVRRLRHLPLNHDLRSDFQYNNLMYLCAGHLAEVVGGASWEEQVRQRILQPLGMQRANFEVAKMVADADHATPYRRAEGATAAIPPRDLTAIGPAGSLNASVREMASWVSLQLQAGRWQGRALLSPTSARDLHVVRMPASSPVAAGASAEVLEIGYALGWFVDVYRGHRRVHHGGNIDGYSALVAMLPEAGFGFVVLTNLDATPVPELVVSQLCDRVLGLEPRDQRSQLVAQMRAAENSLPAARQRESEARHANTSPSLPLASYVGDYADAGYGPCRITQDARGLRLDLHGLQVGLDHWHHDVFAGRKDDGEAALAGTKVQFRLDFDGEIEGVRMVLEPSVPPIEFAPQPDARLADPTFLARLAGNYQLEGQAAAVALAGNKLVVTLPGQRHELEPRRGLRFGLRGLSGYSAEFVLDGEQVKRLRFRQPEGLFEAQRVD